MIGIKKGMTQIFDESGNAIGVTVVEAGPCIVTQVKSPAKEGYAAVQVSFAKKKREIRVDKAEDYQVGQELKADLFAAGDLIHVTGVSIGKGFQGTIKRFHHHRGPMSHGSKSHRLTGSIGSGATPGRVWPGRPMPGRMGNVQVTVRKVRVIQVIAEKNLILIAGSVPGKIGNLVSLRKAK
ncbi:MAG: 50S ribosomal protein L3 [Candidatus Margulisiibacteriota bacterium]